MNEQRFKITQALKVMTEAERGKDFQRLGVQIAKTKWPELEATREWHDGGEDAVAFFAGSDGLKRSLACSLTGTLKKIRDDAQTIKGRGRQIDTLVFVTPVPIDNRTVSDWQQQIQKEFQHGLHVIQETELITLLERPENRWLCKPYLGLELEADLPLAQLAATARLAAAQVLEGWKKAFLYDQGKAIELTLIDVPAEGARKPNTEFPRLSLRHAHELVVQRDRATLVGKPGAGKTFTLIQLAGSLLQDSSSPIPILVSLPVWASSEKDFFAFLEAQFKSHDLKSSDLAKLSASGHIALLLNGWNEIPDASVGRIGDKLKGLAFNNPGLPIVVSSRNSQVSPPFLTGRCIHVAPLSHGQKVSIIKKSGLDSATVLLTELETNFALATVTDSPLFLGAAMVTARPGEPLPDNRPGILRRFVEHFEQGPKHSAALKGPPCNSQHRRYLECIAVKMTQIGGTNLTFDEATGVIGECSKALKIEGQIETISDAAAVLDLLVRHHLLVLSPNLGGTYQFLHQQFQEWFAAQSLHRSVTVLAAGQGAEDVLAFQRNVLNHAQWQEPLLFLMERLARDGEKSNAIAATVVRWAAPVDLLLAAELVGTAGNAIWLRIREELSASLRKWYGMKSEAHQHCALAAMLATRAPDFQDILWPLIESADRNVRLWTYRRWHAFPIECLGGDWRLKFGRWKADRKVEFIREFSWGATREHIALASDLIRTEQSSEVKLVCFELLVEAGVYETLTLLAENLAIEDWPEGFLERIVARLPKRYLEPFLAKAKAALSAIEALSARRAIILTLQRVNDPDSRGLIKAEIEKVLHIPDLDFRPTNEPSQPFVPQPILKQNGSPYLSDYFEAISTTDPDWAAEWLTTHLTEGHFWWEPFTDYLGKLPASLLQRVAEATVDTKLDVGATRQRAVALGRSGSPIAANALVNAYLADAGVKDQNASESHYDRDSALEAGIQDLPMASLIDVVLRRAGEEADFVLIRRVVQLVAKAPISQASDDRKNSIRALVFRLEQDKPQDLNDKSGFRAELVEVLGRVGKEEDAKIIEAWIHEDLDRLEKEQAEQQARFQEWKSGDRKTPAPVMFAISIHWDSYQRALVHIGGPGAADVFVRLLCLPQLLSIAAWGLFLLTQENQQAADGRFGQRPNYFEIHKRQHERTNGRGLGEVNKPFTDAIFSAIEPYIPQLGEQSSKLPKQEVIEAISALAALGDSRAIPLLVSLSADKHLQWTVTEAFHNLTLNGTLLSAKTVGPALDSIISEDGKSWGSNQDNWYMVVRALAVLLLSDEPAVGIEKVRKLPERRLRNHYVRDVLVILGACTAPEAIDLIVELALRPEINESYLYEVATVLSESPNARAQLGLLTLLEKLCSGELHSAKALDHLPRVIGKLAKKGGPIWDEIKRRCTRPKSSLERRILLEILNEIESCEAAICLCDLLNDDLPIKFEAENVIENAVTQHFPVGGNVYQVKPQECSELKSRLINIAHNDLKRRASGLQLLSVVYKNRLERGWPGSEPLHPDIKLLKVMKVPWPLL